MKHHPLHFTSLLCAAAFVGCLAAPPSLRPEEGAEPQPEPTVAAPEDYDLYLALGASSTAGAGASAASASYVHLVRDRLTERYEALVLDNRGLAGRRLLQMPGDLVGLAESDAAVVTVLPLTDTSYTVAEPFEAHARALLEALSGYPVVVFWGTPFMAEDLVCGVGEGPGGCFAPESYEKLETKRDVMARLAEDFEFLVLVPVEDTRASTPDWTDEDGHPTDEGHADLAQQFTDALQATGVLNAD